MKEPRHHSCVSSKTYPVRKRNGFQKVGSIIIEFIMIDNRSSERIGLARLQSQKGLLLRGRRDRLNRLYRLNHLGGGLKLGGFREVLGLDCGLRDRLSLDGGGGLGHLGGSGAAANVLLGLVAVLVHVLLQGTGGVGGTLAGKILELVGLGADNLLKAGDLLVDDFAVADVHERSEVGNGHGDNGETPERNETDEPVASEGSSESLEQKSIRIFPFVVLHIRRSHTATVWTTFSANRMR